MMPGNIFRANRAPFFEGRLREGNSVVYIRSHDAPSDIVIGPMTITLKLPESRDDID